MPSGGPDVTSLASASSTSLTVTWAKLSKDEANGDITEYTICYREGSDTSGDICTAETKTITDVHMEPLTETLTGLKKATSYTVGVKAKNLKGDGPVGKTKTVKTLEDGTYRNE